MAHSGIPRAEWHSRWIEVACDRNSRAKICRIARRREVAAWRRGRWEDKHAAGGVAEQKEHRSRDRIDVLI